LLDGSSVLEELDGTNATTIKYLNNPQQIDEVLAHQRGSQTEYPLTDALGSVYASTDASGNVVHRYDYDVYGARVDVGGTGAAINLGYVGKHHDVNGLMGMGVRPYSPRTGVWLQPDELGIADGPNFYQYVKNQPTTLTDPTGYYAQLGSAAQIPSDRLGEWMPVPFRHSDTGQMQLQSLVDVAFDRAENWLSNPATAAVLQDSCKGAIRSSRVTQALDEIEYGFARPTLVFFFNNKTAKKNGYAAGDSAGLGSRPFHIAFGPGFAANGILEIGGQALVPLDSLATVFVHELLHHYLRFEHASPVDPSSDPIYGASRRIAKNAGYNPWGI